MFTISIKGDENIINQFEGMGAEVRAALMATVPELAKALQGHVVQDKLNGQVLNQRSGALARSIQQESPIEQDGGIYGRVFSSGDVKYAAIHEYGGVIKHPGGTAYIPGLGPGGLPAFISNSAADGLASIGHAVPRTLPHDIPMPERSFLRSSLADQAAEIAQGLKDAVLRGSANALKG